MPQLIDELKQHLAAGEVVIVAGTGVSIQVTTNAPCASWKGLLLDGVRHAEDLGRMTEKLASITREQINLDDPDALISAAQMITTKLGDDLGPWLRQSVGSLKAQDRSVIDALHSLGNTLATTNYDHLLSTPELPPVAWTDAGPVEEILRGKSKGVIHLHGDYAKPDSVILGLHSYDRLKISRHANAVLLAIRTLKTLLFVGCGDGLIDPHFSAFFEWTGDAFASSSFHHFILCRKSEMEKIRGQHLPEQQLFPIAFGADYVDLAGFLRSLRGERPVVVSSSAPPPASTRLPDPGYCFGRDAEIGRIIDALLGEVPARVAVLGVAGIGKTTLTLTALRDRQIAARFGDARYFIRCEQAFNREGLVGVIATQLGISGVSRIEDAVQHALSSGPAVIVLDNFETPWQSATIGIEDYLVQLASIDTLRLIVTLRGTERPGGVAWLSAVEPPLLPLPDTRKAFLAIAGDKFVSDPVLDELLEAMDRLPIAITLMAHVAQREAKLRPLLDRWTNKRTNMLKHAGGEGKANNIEVSFELSIGSPRVTPEAKRLLSILASLPAGIASDDFDVMTGEGSEAAAVLRGTGLAYQDRDRLRMLAPLRAYVVTNYPMMPEDAARVRAFYLDLAARGAEVGHSGGSVTVDRIMPEASNIEAVMMQSLSEGMESRMTTAILGWSQFIRFTGTGSISILDHACEAATAKDDHEAEAKCVRARAVIAYDRYDYERAQYGFERVRALSVKQGDRLVEADALLFLGKVACERDRYDRARVQIQKSLEIYQSQGSTEDEGRCLGALGRILHRQGDYAAATEYYEKSLSLTSDDDSLNRANMLRGIADMASALRDTSSATKHYQDAFRLYGDIGAVYGQATCISGMADLLKTDGRVEEAIAKYREALLLFDKVVQPFSIGVMHMELGNLLRDEAEKRRHVAAARAAWAGIGRQDLIDQYLAKDP